MTHKNILVIQTAFIGDAILASSVLEKLHAFFPEAKISILVRKGNESLYAEHPFLTQTLVWNKQEGKYKSLFRLLKVIRQQKFDTVINLHRFASSGFLTAFSKATYTAGYDKNPFSFLFNYKAKHKIGDGRHEVDRYNDLIESITDKTVSKPKLYPTFKQFTKIEPYVTHAFVTMAASSVWFTKQLPKDKWIELCNTIPKEITIYLLGGPNDKSLCEDIKSKSTHSNIQILAGELSLLESCELMKHARMNYVNDSGPLHLASAGNSPTTAFFCSTIPEYGFYPLSYKSEVIEVKNLDCKPCGLHGHKTCPKNNFRCGNEIKLPLFK
ncbi:MAG TPA: glycosyltransferase family 9 protein [Bacteroidia bacterium]|nr:glycosyltransferase family 9 protein [Bacteroidia bacterium]